MTIKRRHFAINAWALLLSAALVAVWAVRANVDGPGWGHRLVTLGDHPVYLQASGDVVLGTLDRLAPPRFATASVSRLESWERPSRFIFGDAVVLQKEIEVQADQPLTAAQQAQLKAQVAQRFGPLSTADLLVPGVARNGLAALMVVLSGALLWTIGVRIRRGRRAERGCCSECGYPLPDPGHRCPECGT